MRYLINFLFFIVGTSVYSQNCNFSISVPSDITICEPGNVNLNGNISGTFFSYEWNGSNGYNNTANLNPSVNVNQTTTYSLSALSLPTTNLINNGNFSNGNTGFTSDYTYVIDIPGNQFELYPEGTYAVIDNPNLVHTNFSPCPDHTGGGNMMVVNGAAAFQEVWCQTINVNPGQNYIFEAYAVSVNSWSPAILQFSINGNLLGSPFNLTATTCSWQQFYATWDSGSNTSVEICITNQNIALGGNDFALDDIFFGELCKDVQEFTVTLDEFSVTIPYALDINCTSPNTQLIADITPFQGTYYYYWSSPDGTITSSESLNQITVSAGGTYHVEVLNSNGCVNSQTYIVQEDKMPPTVSIEGDTTLDCFQKTSQLTANSLSTGVSYNWVLPDMSTAMGKNLTVSSYGMYVLNSIAPNGCIDADTVQIIFENYQIQYTKDSTGVLTCNENQVQIILDISTVVDSITWNGPGIFNMNQNKDTINVDEAGTYLFELFLGNDCSIKDSVKILKLSSEIKYNLEQPDTLSCNILKTFLFLESPEGIVSNHWYINDTLFSELDTVDVFNAGNYIIKMYDSNGCLAIDSFMVVEDIGIPVVMVTVDSIDCYDDAGQFLSQVSEGSKVVWEGQGVISQEINPIFKIEGVYTLTVIGQNGCSVLDTFFLPSKRKYPVISGTSENITCAQPYGNITLNTDLPSNYSWTGDNGNAGTSNIISSNVAGAYNIEAISSEGCVSNKIYILEIDTIHPTLSDIPDLLLTCIDSILKPSINASLYDQYFWNGPGVNQSSVLNSTISKPGNYSLHLKNDNGCEIIKSFVVRENKTKPVFTASAQDLNCRKPESQLNLNSIENLTYSIDQKNITNGYIIDTAGWYTINAINEFGCTSRIHLEVKGSFNLPMISVNPILLNCKQREFWVSDDILNPNLTYSWQTSSGLVQGDSILIKNKDDIELIAQNSDGCESRIKLVIDTDFKAPVINIDGNKVIGCNKSYTDISILPNAQEIYLWTGSGTTSSNTSNIRISEEGSFELIAENVINGCKSSELFEISKETGPDAIDIIVNQPKCFGDKGSLKVNDIFGGTSPYVITLEQIQLIKGKEIAISSGDYQLIVTDKNGCTTFDHIAIDRINDLEVNAGRDTTILRNESYKLNATSSIDWSEVNLISWSPSESLDCDHCPAPNASPEVDTKYTITIQNENGCIETDEVLIRVKFLKGYIAPNIFNPSSPTGNDIFTIYPFMSSIANLKYLQIFDRWGNMVFNVNDIPAGNTAYGWNGKYNGSELVPGVYIWVSEIEYLDQTTEIGSGDVTIIR